MTGVDAASVTRSHRLPHLVCLGIEGVEAEPVLLGLDQAGVAAHSGSSCSSETLEPSPVLEAMGVDAERSLRLSVGWSTTSPTSRPSRRPSPAWCRDCGPSGAAAVGGGLGGRLGGGLAGAWLAGACR